jgi:hypothetical protein
VDRKPQEALSGAFSRALTARRWDGDAIGAESPFHCQARATQKGVLKHDQAVNTIKAENLSGTTQSERITSGSGHWCGRRGKEVPLPKRLMYARRAWKSFRNRSVLAWLNSQSGKRYFHFWTTPDKATLEESCTVIAPLGSKYPSVGTNKQLSCACIACTWIWLLHLWISNTLVIPIVNLAARRARLAASGAGPSLTATLTPLR